MALKKLGVEQRELEIGKVQKGFLLKKTFLGIRNKNNEVNQVPKLIMREVETAKEFGVLLGAGAIDQMTQMVEGKYTEVTKLPKPKGKDYFQYETAQDEDLDVSDHPVEKE